MPNRSLILTSRLSSSSTNEIVFEAQNHSNNTPGFSLGIELKANDQVVFRDVRGSSTQRQYTGPFGANRQDDSLGAVYRNSIIIHKDMRLPGARPYEVQVFNTSDISQVKVNIANTPISMQASSQYSESAILDPYLNFNTFNDVTFQVISSLVTSPFFTIPNNHPNAKSYTWGFEVKSSLGRIYYNRDGQRENLDIMSFNGQAVGSGARFNQPHNTLGEQVLDDLLRLFVR